MGGGDNFSVKGTAIVSRKGFPGFLGPVEVAIPATEDRPYRMQIYLKGNRAVKAASMAALLRSRTFSRVSSASFMCKLISN